MDLDNVAAELRSRDGAEAIDLGMGIGRHFWTAVIVPWLILVGGVFAAGGLLTYLHGSAAMAVWVLTFLWLFKPAYDRLPLFVVSRGLFGDVPSTRRTLGHTISRWLSMETLFDCTVRRITPYRSFTMPIRELERHSDDQYGNRKKALLRKGTRRPVISLIGVGVVAEQLLLIGTIAFIGMVLPTEAGTSNLIDIARWTDPNGFPTWLAVAGLAVYFTAVTLVEIFYVTSGFGLYINRRVELEGWDIEIEFRRMASRFGDRTGRRAVGLLAAAGLAAGLVLAGGAAQVRADSPDDEVPASMPAETDSESDGASGRDPQTTIDEILEAEEFGHTEERWRWVPTFETDSDPTKQRSSGGSGLKGLAGLLEILLWIAAAGTVVVFAYILATRVMTTDGESTDDERPDGPEEPAVADLETDDESADFRLPPDLVRRASEDWERGDYASSLSLLYRGTIRGLSDHHDIDIAPHMTAMECTRKVEAAGGPGEFVSRLARAWTSTAYADRPPSDDEAEALFATWRRHFGGGSR